MEMALWRENDDCAARSCERGGLEATVQYSCTVVAVLAANRIDRKNEIDAVPAISPWNDLGFKLSRIILSRSC